MNRKLLVVEDNEYKRKRIIELIASNLVGWDIDECYSFNSAWQLISKNNYSVILLDMSLPTFDKTESEPGGAFRVFGGKELARKMSKRKITSKIIFVTQYKNFSDNTNSCSFDSLKSELLEEYYESCVGFILYSNTKSEWRDDLVTAMSEVKQ